MWSFLKAGLKKDLDCSAMPSKQSLVFCLDSRADNQINYALRTFWPRVMFMHSSCSDTSASLNLLGMLDMHYSKVTGAYCSLQP